MQIQENMNMGKKELKTNAMRILDKYKISYTYMTYDCDEFMDGVSVADALLIPYEQMYKTIVTTGKSKEHYVFLIPVNEEIDFKKAANVVGEKSIEMLHLKELTTVTGYVRGGCTSIGMKKEFPTIIHTSAENLDKMVVSGGARGIQLSIHPTDLKKVTHAEYADVIHKVCE